MWLATLATAIIAVPAQAEPGDDTASLPAPHRIIVFSPDRPDRCDYFFVTEFNTSVTGVKSQDGVDHFLFTDGLGLMRNIGHSSAVGLSLDTHLAMGHVRFAPTLRFKQWLARQSSLDFSVGYTRDILEQEGINGPIVEARYSPTPWFHIQAGACRFRNVTSIYYYPNYQVGQTSQVSAYAGIGLGGVPGVVSWGAQAVGFLALVAAFSGMD